MGNRFGIRKTPKWAKNDFEAHLKLAKELRIALDALRVYINSDLTVENADIEFDEATFTSLRVKAQMTYFFDYAMRLQRCYIRLMEMMEPFCMVTFTKNTTSGFSIYMVMEDREYRCNYLNDHVCGLIWVVSKINFHIHTVVQG